MSEQNNKTIAVNVLFVPYNTEKLRLPYNSKHNFKRENKVTLLMITDGKKWHYLGVNSLSALLRGITSNHKGDFNCLNCFHSYSTKNDRDYYVEMPNEDNKILKCNHGKKSLKSPAIIYADLECLLEKMHSCQNNLEKFSTDKKTKHSPSAYSLFTNWSFDATKNKLDCYKGEDYMERFRKGLKYHAMKKLTMKKKK